MNQGGADNGEASGFSPHWAVLNRAAWHSRWRDRAGSTRMAEQLCAAARAGDAGARALLGEAFRTLAWQAKWKGRFHEAERYCIDAERHLVPRGASAALADTYAILCVISYSRNDFASAREFIRAARNMLTEEMPIDTRIDVRATEALLMRHSGQPEEALKAIDALLEMASGADTARLAHVRTRLLTQLGQSEAALLAGRDALELSRSHRNRVVFPYTCEVYGGACRISGDVETAERTLAEGYRAAEEDEDQRAQCQILEQQAMVALDQGHPDAALRLLRRGLAISEQINYPLWRRNFLRKLAQEYEKRGEANEALAAYKSLLAMLERDPR